MKQYLLLPLLLAVLFQVGVADDCKPLYWEVDPSFVPTSNEGEIYAQSPLFPNNLNRSRYSLNNIKGINTFDSSQRTVANENNTMITVSNNVMDISFTFFTNKTKNLTSKQYNGVGSALVKRVVFNYTKKLTISSGVVFFDIVNLSLSVPNAFMPGNYSPTPDAADKAQFDKLVKEDLYFQVKELITSTIRDSIRRIADKQNFGNFFGDSTYSYNYNGVTLPINTTIHEVEMTTPAGVILGYEAGLNGRQRVCGQFVPPSGEKATYITVDMMKELVTGYAATTTAWSNMRLDNSNARSDAFQFLLIDLEDIIPEALNKYTSILSKLYATCTVNPDSIRMSLDDTYSLVWGRADWNCQLDSAAYNANLLNVSFSLVYEAKVYQSGSALKVRSTSVKVADEGALWQAAEGLTIVNENMALLYLKSVLPNFQNVEFFGSGFPQPLRNSPEVSFGEWAISIKEKSTINQLRTE